MSPRQDVSEARNTDCRIEREPQPQDRVNPKGSSFQGQHLIHDLLGLVGGPVGPARQARPLPALAVVDHGGGNAVGAGREAEHQGVGGIVVEAEAAVPLKEVPGRLPVLQTVDADRHHLEALLGVVLLQPGQARHLLLAGRAPGGPEVHHHRLLRLQDLRLEGAVDHVRGSSLVGAVPQQV